MITTPFLSFFPQKNYDFCLSFPVRGGAFSSGAGEPDSSEKLFLLVFDEPDSSDKLFLLMVKTDPAS